MNRAYKFRIYPTEKQAELIRKTAGSARFIYNNFLGDAKTNKYQGYTTYANSLKALKAENPWLREADSIALQQAIKNLETAFDRFFHRLGNYPQFKKKHKSNCSYRTMNVKNNIRIKDSFINCRSLDLFVLSSQKSSPALSRMLQFQFRKLASTMCLSVLKQSLQFPCLLRLVLSVSILESVATPSCLMERRSKTLATT